MGHGMPAFARFVLRLVLVPLGYLLGGLAGSFVMLLAVTKIGRGAIDLIPPYQDLAASLGAVPLLLTVLLALMWLPAIIGILISEAFAIRSWMFHAGNWALSTWIGWHLSPDLADAPIRINDPIPMIAAGLAGGLAYWAIAGCSAGFWKPVFRRCLLAASSASPPPQIR